MNLNFQWMQSVWFKALGWTFVHSLWQIAIIGLVLFIILRLIPGSKAHARYTISTFALWLIVISGLSTFILMLPEKTSVTEYSGQIVWLTETQSASFTDRISVWLESRMPIMLTVWIGGVMLLMIRLAFSMGWVRHMRTTSVVSSDIQHTINTIVNRLHLKVRPITSESRLVQSPVTIGHLKPLILFPIGIINQLTPQEVEAILTHELAHIVRRDYLSNLIQSFIETLFYYHPITWWISRMVRTERENRADDLAISWCGNQLGYVKALMTVEEMQIERSTSLAIGFASHKGAMLARIQRILHIPYKNHNQMEKTVLLSLCSLCFLAFTFTSHTNTEAKKENTLPVLEKIMIPAIIRDTIPSEGTYRIHKKTDDQDINIEVEDGDIKELQIDGKEIQPDDFDQYDNIIEELFGGMDVSPAPMGFNFEMPRVPPVAGILLFPDLPDMPPLPEMRGMDLDRLMELKELSLHNGQKAYMLPGNGSGSTIIIYGDDGDTSVIMAPGAGFNYTFGDHPAMAIEGHRMMNADEMREHAKEWELQGKEWQKLAEEWKQDFNEEEWKLQAEDWKKKAEEWQQEWSNQARGNNEEWRAQQEELRENLRHYQLDRESLREQIQEGLEEGHPAYGFTLEAFGGFGDGSQNRVYSSGRHIGDMMAEDGLIHHGESAEIVLTPDKLKINGKKMDDEMHEKYLRMYEAQQGVKLSGNSRVEFRLKSRGSM
ncbi:MAG: M48 family metalloprotease [Bacteroidota bacterium]|nr:M48 family metalloprotease [Bacteroidota bacterium]